MVDGLRHYLDNGSKTLWDLLKPVIESLPDQCLERQVAAVSKTEVNDQANGEADGGARQDTQARLRKCVVCDKKHAPVCKITNEWRKQDKEKKRAARSADAKPAGDAKKPRKY